MNKKALLRVGVALSMVLAFTFIAHEYRSNSTTSADFPTRVIASADPLVDLSIVEGSSGSEIGKLLFDAGIIESAQSFFKLAIADPRASRIAPGVHQLNLKISSQQALEQLLDPKRMPNLIKIAEGAWNSEILMMLEQNGFDRSDIQQAATKVVLPEGFTTLEGLLFPAQYSFAKGSTALDAFDSMITNFVKKTQSLALDKDPVLNKQQIVTAASIIQAEGNTEDFAKISRVIRNRLKFGMPLQMDSTVHYVKKVRGSVFLSTQSTLLRSPYNTYRKYGLPPGPIGNPGFEALNAAINPVDGNWLYFITVSPGDTRFTSDIAEFNTWKILYTKNRKAGAFK
jgi:UPF0755 protein